MEGLPTWAKVGIGVIGVAIAITTGVGATYVATTMAKSAICGAIFNGAIYGVSSLVTGHFDKTELINSMLHGAADMFMVSGVMLGAKGVVDCVARNSGRIREAMLANEEGSSNIVEKLDDFYESRVSGKTSYGKSSGDIGKKTILKKYDLPTQGKIRFIPEKKWKPNQTLKKINGGFVDRFDNIWVKGPSRTADEAFEWDVQLSQQGIEKVGWLSRDNTHLNVSLKGKITHK